VRRVLEKNVVKTPQQQSIPFNLKCLGGGKKSTPQGRKNDINPFTLPF